MTQKRRNGQRRSPNLEAAILKSFGHAIIASDSEGKIIYWNKAAEAVYGWRAEEVIGRNAREVGAPTFPEKEAREIIALIRGGETWMGQLPLQRRDIRSRGGERAFAKRNCEPIGVASLSRDVTGN